ncbi:MAG: hypothetical protein CMJ46_15630, partial [Planctomyces sp.]|nr:hypothetical protein [Planctomyces sp.]
MRESVSAFVPLTRQIGRRTFLKIGALASGGVTLASQLEQLHAQESSTVPPTAVIQIFMGGGPSHIDMYDLKPHAPREIRGEFQPIPTSVPGCFMSEHLPNQAQVMDKLAIVRSVQHTNSSHLPASHWMMTGYDTTISAKQNFNPSIGAVVSRMRGANAAGMPGYVSIPKKQLLGGSAYLGLAHNPFTPDSDPSSDDFAVQNLTLAPGLTNHRLSDRRSLRAQFDQLRHQVEADAVSAELDQFSQQAYDLVTGERAVKAFDLTEEDPRLREQYGLNGGGQGCLLARRLVEAGVTLVTVLSGGEWDTHTDNFDVLKTNSLPRMDKAISALVNDIYNRGLDRHVMVVAYGEFGRTPTINKDAGRDHWPGA